MNKYYGEIFQEWEVKDAEYLIKKFQTEWPCLRREETEDLTQELLTHRFFSKDEFNPNREASRRTFMNRIMRNKLHDLVRERQAVKRKINHLDESLDAPVRDSEGSLPLVETIEKGFNNTSFLASSSGRLLKMDLSKALCKLNPKQRKLCRLIYSGFLITEISEELKISRSKVYDEIIRIRKVFQKDGLKEYLN